MTTNTMRAAFIERTGGPEEIQVGTLPVPRPGPTDVLVRVEACGVNHVDLFVRSGAYPTPTPFPFVVGRDLVGTVAEAGPGAPKFRAGDRVWCNSLGHEGRQGSFAEYAVVPAERLYALPNDVPATDAVAVLHTAGTAHIGLLREGALRAGETVFVGGGAGGVGSAVIQIASNIGARVVATASPQDDEWCRSCGADEVLDYRDPDLYELLRKAAPDGFDVWWDNSGTNDLESALPLLRAKGRVIVVAGLMSRPTLPIGELYLRDASLRGFVISNASVDDLAQAAETINRMLASGSLRARVARVLPLEDAAEAHRLMASGGQSGRLVVVP